MRRLFAAAMLLGLAACATATPPQYVVYFPKGDAVLTPDAQAVVAQAATAAKSNSGKLLVAGQAEGGKPQDATLADERAGAVIKALTVAGVPAPRIEKSASAPPAGITGVAAHQVTVVFQH